MFDATEGEKSYLRATGLTVSSVDPLKAGDNIGNTFAIRCRYSNGAELPADQESGAYWATNLVPPAETSLTPVLRWMFVAPTTDTYECRISVTSYSTIIKDGRTVGMKIPAGAQIVRSRYGGAARWTLPDVSAAVVARGSTLTTLGQTYAPVGSGRTTVVQDAQLTTCKPASSICSGGTSAYTGTQVETWIEAQPQKSDGTACGSVVKGPVSTWSISTAKHHQTATNSLYLEKAQLSDCPRMRLSLKIRNVDGNPLQVHAGWVLGRVAATRGLAVTAG
ncbi:hypothetical protein DVK44_09050 [Streptomyces paludis]|uniref:Uncharacterized protein n=2 Tax=Streptomyces paludis TaxID=2282738 RepID=A0A345I0J9_9ACTN|nr:hypothetical protein DVK44_09050 [Streptomyces paludis]